MNAGPQTTALRLGIDLGGTKIAGIALAAGGDALLQQGVEISRNGGIPAR